MTTRQRLFYSRRKHGRSLAIAACLVALVVLFYAITWVKLSAMNSADSTQPPQSFGRGE